MTQSRDDKVSITAADMERFHRNARAAIKRREGSYAFDEFGDGLRYVFLGGVPLVGLIWFDWSAVELLLFLLAGSWIGILCDFAKLWLLEKQVRKWGEVYYEDWHVWVVADALRVGEKHAVRSHLKARYKPWSGVAVDFIFGGISTLLIVIGLVRSPEGMAWSGLIDRSMLLWLTAVVLYQIVFTAWEILEHKSDRAGDRQVKVAVGLRGVGLFIFVFLLVAATNEFEQTASGVKWTMLVLNGMIVVWGLLTMIGPLFLDKETAWLREYLKGREADEV